MARRRSLGIVRRVAVGLGPQAATLALLAGAGLTLPDALELISEARGITVPDTSAQHRWLEAFEARQRPPS